MAKCVAVKLEKKWRNLWSLIETEIAAVKVLLRKSSAKRTKGRQRASILPPKDCLASESGKSSELLKKTLTLSTGVQLSNYITERNIFSFNFIYINHDDFKCHQSGISQPCS